MSLSVSSNNFSNRIQSDYAQSLQCTQSPSQSPAQMSPSCFLKPLIPNFQNQKPVGGASSFGSFDNVVCLLNQVIQSIQQLVSAVTTMFQGVNGANPSQQGASSSSLPTTAGSITPPSVSSPSASGTASASSSTNATSSSSAVGIPTSDLKADGKKKESTLERILSLGEKLVSIFSMVGSGGTGLLSMLGGLFKGGSGKISGLLKKGLSFFGKM